MVLSPSSTRCAKVKTRKQRLFEQLQIFTDLDVGLLRAAQGLFLNICSLPPSTCGGMPLQHFPSKATAWSSYSNG